MFGILDNPIVETAIFGVLGGLFLLFGYADIPPKTYRKTGKHRPFSDIWKHTSRTGKRLLFVGSLCVIAAVMGIVFIVSS